MILKFSVLAAVLFSLVGCDNSAPDNVNAEARFSHLSLTSKQFANLTNIPEKAEQKREAAFSAFTTRSRVADYLLESELKGQLNITRRLVDTKSRIVLDAYFDKYLSSAVTDEAIQEYYSNNSDLFSTKEYELSSYQIRVKPSGDVERKMREADDLYKDLMGNVNPLNLNKYAAVASNKNLVLTSTNADVNILQALVGLSKGSYSQPVKTKRGIQIFKVISIKANPVALESVKPKIEYKLKELLKQDEYKRLSLITQD